MSRFRKIFVEEQIIDHPQTRHMLAKLGGTPVTRIQKVGDIFGRVRKPYLHKRNSLDLFIGRKEGKLVKPAPEAYGVGDEPHYYFIHAYNCIYECEYCYLQGYFQSPDLVFFVNHDDILAEVEKRCAEHSRMTRVWFHAGEFSDSLALCHLSNELPLYWDFFASRPKAVLELRTKSVNIRPVLALGPLPNIIVTFSLSPSATLASHDRRTPSLQARLGAMKTLARAGFQLGVHLDPIIYAGDFETEYQRLIERLLEAVPATQIEYTSLGVIRFTADVYHEVQRNYPESSLLSGEFVKSFDGKMRYNRPQRLMILNRVREICTAAGLRSESVYLCMENDQ